MADPPLLSAEPGGEHGGIGHLVGGAPVGADRDNEAVGADVAPLRGPRDGQLDGEGERGADAHLLAAEPLVQFGGVLGEPAQAGEEVRVELHTGRGGVEEQPRGRARHRAGDLLARLDQQLPRSSACLLLHTVIFVGAARLLHSGVRSLTTAGQPR